jgi:DNA-binding NarL/FixJ family response regulator
VKRKIKIILADDHPVYRDGLKRMLEVDPELELIHETGDGRDALEQARRLKTDVLLLDVDMPRMNGVEVARERHRQKDSFDIIFLTMHREEDLFNQAMELGVKGYMLKDSAGEEIRNAVRSVAEGRPY